MRTTTLKGISGLYYVEIFHVPVRVSKDKTIGEVITANLGDLEKLVARELILQAVPLQGREVQFLRKALGMSMEKFAVHLGLTAASILKWERATDKRLALVNEFAVRGFVAERLKLGSHVKFSDLSDNSETPRKLAIDWNVAKKRLVA